MKQHSIKRKIPRKVPTKPAVVSTPVGDTCLVRTRALQDSIEFHNECYWLKNLDTADARAAYMRIFSKPAPRYSLLQFLKEKYQELFEMPAPSYLSRSELQMVVGYEIQNRGIQKHGLHTKWEFFRKSFCRNHEASELLRTNQREVIHQEYKDTCIAFSISLEDGKRETYQQQKVVRQFKKKRPIKKLVPRKKIKRRQ